MKIDIEEIAETLLWENVSKSVEKISELKAMLEGIGYMDKELAEKIDECEVLETEEFCIINVREQAEHIQVEFEMPFILYCWQNKAHMLRVTACVSGICEIPDDEHFDYDTVDFSSMNRKELLSYGNMVRIFDVEYSDVEAEQI